MSESRGSLPPAHGRALQPIVDDTLHALQLRRELAELEFVHDRELTRRCVLVGGPALAALLVGVTLLFSAAAWELAQATSLPYPVWLAVLGLGLGAPGAYCAARSLHTWRQDFSGLQGTRAELDEDLVWLREWLRHDRSEPGESRTDDGGPAARGGS